MSLIAESVDCRLHVQFTYCNGEGDNIVDLKKNTLLLDDLLFIIIYNG